MSPLFPYTTLFRSHANGAVLDEADGPHAVPLDFIEPAVAAGRRSGQRPLHGGDAGGHWRANTALGVGALAHLWQANHLPHLPHPDLFLRAAGEHTVGMLLG